MLAWTACVMEYDKRAHNSSDTQRRLWRTARNIADAYIAHSDPRAVLLTGSVGEGLADELSDIDLIAYYDVLPPQQSLERAHAQIGGTALLHNGFSATFRVDGVECEVAHFIVAEAERRLATVLDDHEADTRVHKHLMGITAGQALHGEPLIRSWQNRAADFPERLRRNMAEFYVNRQFPFWYIEGFWQKRDAHLWLHQTLVETGFNVLGALSGTNRLYFSPFQFKRLRQFVDRMAIAPPGLADRLDRVFLASEGDAMREGEQLFGDVLELVEAELPGLDTSGLRHRPGMRGSR
jgi:hypothetical protein